MARKFSTTRKGLALGLAVVGIAGLSLASAAQLNLSSTHKVQTGSVKLIADCQTSPITVSFAVPDAQVTLYKPASMTVGPIDPACLGYNYKMTPLGTNGSMMPYGEGNEGGYGYVTSGVITMDFTKKNFDTNNIDGVALTIYK